MTQYSDRVAKVRLQQEAEDWGKGVKYLHVNDGIIETKYMNGDIHYEEINTGKRWTVYAEEPTNLIDQFLRWRDANGKR